MGWNPPYTNPLDYGFQKIPFLSLPSPTAISWEAAFRVQMFELRVANWRKPSLAKVESSFSSIHFFKSSTAEDRTSSIPLAISSLALLTANDLTSLKPFSIESFALSTAADRISFTAVTA